MMTNFARLLNKLTDMYSGDRNEYINSFNSFPLLIIDDLGVERNSEFAREQVFNIIDSRYRSQLPMIVTTNLTVDELKNPADLARARIYDRVLERCTAIKVNDQNIRKLNMAENLAKAKQLLGGDGMTEQEKKLLQAKHRMEEAEARNRKKERSIRTRRLIQEGAILESVFPQAQHMDLEVLKAILEKRLGTKDTNNAG